MTHSWNDPETQDLLLEKLRLGGALNSKEQATNQQGQVSLLLDLHQQLDQAVFAAYGWNPALSDEALLENLVALNQARASEEAEGRIRWLRPSFQSPVTRPDFPAGPEPLNLQEAARQLGLSLPEDGTAEALIRQLLEQRKT